MKKTYYAPEIKVERFEVEDIITASGTVDFKAAGTGVTSDDAVYEVLVDTQW